MTRAARAAGTRGRNEGRRSTRPCRRAGDAMRPQAGFVAGQRYRVVRRHGRPLATSQRARADADDATRDKLNRAVVHRKSRFHECSTSY